MNCLFIFFFFQHFSLEFSPPPLFALISVTKTFQDERPENQLSNLAINPINQPASRARTQELLSTVTR